MPGSLSDDLRKRIVRAVEGGMSRNAAAKKFDVAPSTAIKIVKRYETTGSWKAQKVGGHKKHLLLPHQEKVLKILEEKPDITLAEMQKRLASDNINVGPASIARFFKYLGISYKKNGLRQRTKP